MDFLQLFHSTISFEGFLPKGLDCRYSGWHQGEGATVNSSSCPATSAQTCSNGLSSKSLHIDDLHLCAYSSQLWMHISNAFKLRNHPIRIGPATDCQINPGYEDGDEPRLPGAARGGKPSEHTLVRTDRLSRHRRYLFSHDLHNVMQYAACTKTHKKRVQTCLLHNQKRAKDVSQPGSFCTFKPSLAKVLDPMVPGLTSWLWDRWASLSSLGSMTVQCPTSKFLFH